MTAADDARALLREARATTNEDRIDRLQNEAVVYALLAVAEAITTASRANHVHVRA